MSKFKIGDKVRIINRDRDNSSGFYDGWCVRSGGDGCVGRIGYVTAISSDIHYYINEDPQYIGKEISTNYYGLFTKEDIELVEEVVFEIGDKIRMNRNCSGNMEGEIFILEYRDKSLFAGMCYCSQYWELIEKRGTFESSEKNNNNDSVEVSKDNTSNMDLLKKFADALLGEPERSLQKYEITDSRGNLTTQGAGLYLNWKFKQDLPEFQKDVLAVLIKADKKGKKDEE